MTWYTIFGLVIGIGGMGVCFGIVVVQEWRRAWFFILLEQARENKKAGIQPHGYWKTVYCPKLPPQWICLLIKIVRGKNPHEIWRQVHYFRETYCFPPTRLTADETKNPEKK